MIEAPARRTPEHSLLASQIAVGFRQWVGAKTGVRRFSDTPDVLLPQMPTDNYGKPEVRINPDWQDWIVSDRLMPAKVRTEKRSTGELATREVLLPHRTPGQLLYNRQTHEWVAVDDESPVGKIALLQRKAQDALSQNISEKEKIKLEKDFRKELVGIYNDYASIRWNGQREVVNGRDFRGLNINNMSSQSLLSWRSDLLRTSTQSRDPLLFERWEAGDKKLQTPSTADRFLSELFTELSSANIKGFDTKDISLPDRLSASAKVLYRMLSSRADENSIALANIFYAGDMLKTYHNLSAVAQMSGLTLPENWQAFIGTTAEFRILRSRFDEFSDGVEGYLQAADDLYSGNMHKTYQNLSAVAMMSGLTLPENWQAFIGTTAEFRIQVKFISSISKDSFEEYRVKFYPDKKYLKKAKLNFAAIRKMVLATPTS